MTRYLPAILCATLGLMFSAIRINHGLIDSPLPAGAGLTLDESFNIAQGIYLYESVADRGPLILDPVTAMDVFEAEGYLPDHPPLGRFILGAAHQFFSPFIRGNGAAVLNVPAARLGSSLSFAATLFILATWLSTRYGHATALLGCCFLALMPRVMGHSRIAALETTTNLMWAAALLAILQWWTGEQRPTGRQAAFSGSLWGLLMLTKVQGILFPPMLVIWAFWQFGWRSFKPLLIFGVTGGVVFFVGWPWLWLGPVDHVLKYLGHASDRQDLYVWYLGQRFSDKLVPWHFPLVMSLTTIPLFAFGGLVLRATRWKLDSAEQLLLLSSIWPLVVFSLPGTPVYDATRLFLPIMPAIAALAARGVVCSWESRRWRLAVTAIVALALFAVPGVLSPFALCHYNQICGGPLGANSIGLETSYWGDGLNGDFWSQVPDGSTLYVAPVCHQFQLRDVEQMVPVVRERNIKLKSFLYDPKKQRGLLLIIHRLGDVRPSLREIPPGAQVVAETRYRGVVLARLVDTTNADWNELPDWPGL